MINEIIAGVVILAIGWLFSVPSRLFRVIASALRAKRIRKNLASGCFDERTINSAVRYYVRPKYSNIDPSVELEPADALVCARADLFEMVDLFLSSKSVDQKHLLLFADSGMGKTSFLINYFDRSHQWFKRSRNSIHLISLSQPNADRQIESIELPERKNWNLFLDALDEDPKALDCPEGRIAELLRTSDGYRTVTITCRTQFFRNDEQIPVDTGVSRIGPVRLNQKKHYQFIRAYLAPLDDLQIQEYLERRFPGPLLFRKRYRAKQLISRVPSLSVRPMLLAHIPEIMGTNTQLSNSFDVYSAMVDAWIERESSWIRADHLQEFSQRLAIELFLSRAERGGEQASPEEIEGLAAEIGFEVSPALVKSRSLLNRTTDGRYKFAHRSILEYFVVVSALRQALDIEADLTDQMASFLLESIGCSSPSTLRLAHSSHTRISFVAAEPRLGFLTNFNLYREIGDAQSIGLLLREPFQTSPAMTIPARSIGELLNDMSSTGLGLELPQTREVRISFSPTHQKASSASVYITIWTNSYAVIGEVTMSAVRLRALFSDQKAQEGFTLLCQPTKLTNDLSQENWKVLSRIDIFSPNHQLPENLTALGSSPLTGFSYQPDGNILTVHLIRTRSAEVNELTPFGFLEPFQLTQIPKRPYGQISPRRLEYRAPLT